MVETYRQVHPMEECNRMVELVSRFKCEPRKGTEKEASRAELSETIILVWCCGSLGGFAMKTVWSKVRKTMPVLGIEISLWLIYRQFRSIHTKMRRRRWAVT